eukprot:SM000130S27128  [mRNA]  locus=s130:394127:394654:+ [translate_table: standard]
MAMRLPRCSGAGGDDDLVSSGSSPQPSPEKGVAPPLQATIIAQGPAQAPVISSAPSPLVNLQQPTGTVFRPQLATPTLATSPWLALGPPSSTISTPSCPPKKSASRCGNSIQPQVGSATDGRA